MKKIILSIIFLISFCIALPACAHCQKWDIGNNMGFSVSGLFDSIFLTSLLLVYSTNYTLNKDKKFPEIIPTIGSDEFNLIFTKERTKVLKIGSVYSLQ